MLKYLTIKNHERVGARNENTRNLNPYHKINENITIFQLYPRLEIPIYTLLELSKVCLTRGSIPSFSRNHSISLSIHFLSLKWRQLLEDQADQSSEHSRRREGFAVPGHRRRPPPSRPQLQPSPHGPPLSSRTVPVLPHVTVYTVLLPVRFSPSGSVQFLRTAPSPSPVPEGRVTIRSEPACALRRRIPARSGAASTKASARARQCRRRRRQIG